jgi:hypothetical protein
MSGDSPGGCGRRGAQVARGARLDRVVRGARVDDARNVRGLARAAGGLALTRRLGPGGLIWLLTRGEFDDLRRALAALVALLLVLHFDRDAPHLAGDLGRDVVSARRERREEAVGRDAHGVVVAALVVTAPLGACAADGRAVMVVGDGREGDLLFDVRVQVAG